MFIDPSPSPLSPSAISAAHLRLTFIFVSSVWECKSCDQLEPRFIYNFITPDKIIGMYQDSHQLELSPSNTNKPACIFSLESPCNKADPAPPAYKTHEAFLSLSPIKCTKILRTNQQQPPLELSPDFDHSPGGDRYIPKRKFVKKESLISEDDRDAQAENKGVRSEQEGVSVSDLYLRLVMTDSPRKRRQTPIQSFENTNILKFSTRPQNASQNALAFKEGGLQWTDNAEKESPRSRKVNKVPIKVLDAPSLQDDYYLNLLDWGSQNHLAVGLNSSVYLWNSINSKVLKLCDLGNPLVTGVGWSQKEPLIAVGSESGEVEIWDIQKMKKVRSLIGHTNRVGALSWSSTLLSTGSRDKTILNRDIRDPSQFISKYEGHKQEVCGLKWSPDHQQLCSGGNDNRLLVWSPRATEPVLKYHDHTAAVKAVAWSPHQHGLLVSGGGTADRTIRFRNTLTGSTTKVVQAGSQVCCLMFSKLSNELVSTHGYQMNEINLWKVPSMSKVTSLTGHSSRVLYLAMSSEGHTIVTGAGDETLRFWNLFPKKSDNPRKNSGFLQCDNSCLR